MNAIEYISPPHRRDPGAAEFADVLAATIDWKPQDFGSGYAWDAVIPPPADYEREALALKAHLDTL